MTILILSISALPARAQISPGELSQPHAFLEGIKNCLNCHKLGSGPSAEKCLECHREIEVRMKQEKGFHYVVVNDGSQSCFSCHNEHAGRGFRLINWPDGRKNFDHSTTGWSLQGAHAVAECRQCHKPALIKDDLSAHRSSINLKTTFLGLRDECVSCHTDEHRGQLSDDCTGCHGVETFEKAPGFDHHNAKFRLTGKHENVTCDKCHKSVSDKQPWDKNDRFTRFAPVPHDNCKRCHSDPHEKQLGECASCHATSGWRDVADANFDHSRTHFALVGRHSQVVCEQCHGDRPRSEPIRFDACTSCHADPHQGQFASRPDEGRCDACHNESGFAPALFTAEDHAEATFALTGAHLAQPCASCHVAVTTASGTTFEKFRFQRTDCAACHRDEHHQQFAPKTCEACHIVDGWHSVDFVHDRDSSYKLDGEHRGVVCSGCHVSVGADGGSFIRYKPIDPSCETCHADKSDMRLGG